MNAVAEARVAVSVVLLGPADAAREQLRQALVGFGADVTFEGEVRDGIRLAGKPAPEVLIVNLEPGVEDDLDALQDLLDNPATAVVFNEGEVSSQLTGWDLARWARHLAAKVLGVRDTLPPPPSGAERLPELTLLPEPGRPASPSQQQDHLRFDDYAEEALGHSGEVPASLRLELEPERSEVAAPDLGALDFDFSPIQAAEPAEAAATAPRPADEDHPDLLESMDLSTLFEQDMGEVTPDDMLLKLQQAMGLEPARADPARSAEPPAAAPSASEAATPVRADAVPMERADQDGLPPSGDAGGVAEIAGLNGEAGDAPLDFSWEPAPSAEAAADTEPAIVQLPAGDSAVLEFDFASVALESLPAEESSPGALPPDASLHQAERQMAEVGDLDAEAVLDPGFSFDPVAFDAEDDVRPARARAEPLDALELDAIESDADLAEFDFGAFDAAVESPRAAAGPQAPRYDAEDAALGGTLTLDAGVDDEEIARLAAALDEAPALPSAADLPPLEFDFARPAEIEPAPDDRIRSAALPSAPAPAPASATAARAEAPAPAAAAKQAKTGFGELSLQPLTDGFIDPGVVKAAEAPAKDFDFSHLTLSLEPIEADAPATPALDPDGVQVTTMRDGAWLRDIGEGPQPEPAATAEPSEAAGQEEAVVDLGAGELGYEFVGAVATPPPLPSPAAGVSGTAAAARAVAPLTQGISRVVVLCASIGGPDALRGFLAGIPAGFPALFLVVQHLENGYFERLAQQLQKASPLPVRVPMAGLSARDGEVLVVASGSRFQLAVDGQVELGEPVEASRYRPCIDDVLRDVADTFGPHAHAIIFSGMAADAVEGAVYLTRQGGEVWAQDPETCVVSSMVDGARSRGVVEFIGSPRELAEHCVRQIGANA